MKKIITLLLITGITAHAWAQSGNVFTESENDYYSQTETHRDPGTGVGGGGGLGEEDPPPSPIDDYVPLLALVGGGLAVYFARKKYAPAS